MDTPIPIPTPITPTTTTTTTRRYAYTVYARVFAGGRKGRAGGAVTPAYRTPALALAAAPRTLPVVVRREAVTVGEHPDGSVWDFSPTGRYTLYAQGLYGTLRGLHTITPEL